MRLDARRHHEQAPPTAELDLLKSAGLMSLAIGRENGGAGISWRTVNEIVREITAADGSVGVLLGYHVISVVHLRREDPTRRQALEREITSNQFFLAGVANPRDDDIQVEPLGGGYIFNGRKSFCTGAAFADRLTIYGRMAETGQAALAYIPANRAGITYHHDWDNLGLCRTESGSFSVENVRVQADELTIEADDERTASIRALRTPVNHNIFTNCYLGFALGAFRAARKYVGEKGQGWQKLQPAAEDPLIVTQFGDIWVELQAGIALAERAALKVGVLLEGYPNFDEKQRGDAAIDVATAKIHASRAAISISSKIFEPMGARSTHNRNAFDRFWRDSRTHTLHDPLIYKVFEVGDFALNQRYPEVGPYS
ncbi:MAG: acyl-CoA dehydrogenase family protein [Nisaea sp.]